MKVTMGLKRRPLVVAAMLAGVSDAGPTLAQDIRIDVTGTNIPRLEREGALPVQIITREEIARTGAQTAAELLQYVAANDSGGAVSLTNVIGSQTHAVSTASLRGLGGQNTLVLLDGKRLTGSSGEVQGVYGVNLDSIPFSAIERVEILTDGASAVYGSDAIGGVINFILRQDFRGAEITGFYGTPTRRGGGKKWNAAATVGSGDLTTDKFNASLSAYYGKTESLDQNKRNFSDSSANVARGVIGISGNTFPAYITTGGIGTPGFPNCAPGIYDPALDAVLGVARCVYDPAAVDGVNSIPEQKTTSLFTSGRWQFHPSWQLYGTAAYTRVDTRYVIQPAPVSDTVFYGPNNEFPATFLLPPSSPYYPAALAEAAGVNGQPLNLRYRAYALGMRDMTDTNAAWQAVAGIKGRAWNWDFDIDWVYGRNDTSSRPNNGFARYSQLLPLLNSGHVNPFGPDTPEVQAEVDALQFKEETFRGESASWLVDGKASGELFNVPAARLAGAFGFQAGKSGHLAQTFNPAYEIGDITGFALNYKPTSVDRDSWAAFAESQISTVKNFECNAAVRYDEYSDFGHTTNPKLSMRWNPVQQVLLRGSWGTGFVAPTLTQAYGANTRGLTVPGLTDPLRCPITHDTSDCLGQFTAIFGGNPKLKPQKSDQWMLGLVLEPVRQVSLAFDWFNLDVKEMFSNFIPTTTILNDQASPSPQFAQLVTRGPVQPQYPNIPGPITSIDQRFTNVGRVKIQGVDVNVKADSSLTAFGRFSLTLNGSYYRKYDVQQADGTFVGAVSNQLNAVLPGLTPRYKQYATITWTHGSLSTTVGNQYQSSYIDVATDVDGNPRRVGRLLLWDLYFAYTGFKNWKFTLGVQNLFDKNPEYTNQQTTFQSGYDPTFNDARTRFVYGSITYSTD